jgi:hypothetical protein
MKILNKMLNIGDLGNSVDISGDGTVGDFGGGGQVFIWVFLVSLRDFG